MARYIHRKFSKRSYTALAGVAPPLVTIASLALVTGAWDFVVIEGKRSMERQKQLVAEGLSWTLQSRHLDGRAIDIMAFDARGEGTWRSHYYVDIAEAFNHAAAQLSVPLTWGGEWTQRDYGHFEIPREYSWLTH